MKKFILTIVLAALCLFFKVDAQSQNNNIKPLNISDTVPEAVWNMPLEIVNHPQGKKTITLNDYRGKLIILDFWATWCSSCIINFPKFEKLQNDLKGQLQIMGVAYENKSKIIHFFNTALSPEKTKYHFSSIIQDTVLNKLFPHHFIPHCVWISPDGIVMAITSGEEVKLKNVNKYLSAKGPIDIEVKHDINPERPLFLSENYSAKNYLSVYSILSEGNYPGLGSGNRFRKSKDLIYGRAVTNSPLLLIYEAAMHELFKSFNDSYNRKRLINNVKKPELVTPNMSSDNNGTWATDNYYNFELIVPLNKADSLYYFMVNDLNRYTDFKGSIKDTSVQCYSLVRTSNRDKLKSKGGHQKNSLFYQHPAQLINMPLKHLLGRLNDEDQIKYPVIDETGYTEPVDLQLSGNIDIKSIKEELQAYDLDLLFGKRVIPMFILEDKKKMPITNMPKQNGK